MIYNVRQSRIKAHWKENLFWKVYFIIKYLNLYSNWGRQSSLTTYLKIHFRHRYICYFSNHTYRITLNRVPTWTISYVDRRLNIIHIPFIWPDRNVLFLQDTCSIYSCAQSGWKLWQDIGYVKHVCNKFFPVLRTRAEICIQWSRLRI